MAGSQDETSFREPRQKQASLCLFILRIESEKDLFKRMGGLVPTLAATENDKQKVKEALPRKGCRVATVIRR